MIIDANNRPVPVVLLLVEALKKIRAGDRSENNAICGNVAKHLVIVPEEVLSAVMDILNKKCEQWAEKKDRESPERTKRTGLLPVPNFGAELKAGALWTNKERLQLLEWLIDQLSMTPVAMVLECLYGVHPTQRDLMLHNGGKEFAICTQTQTLLELMPQRKKWPEECAEKVRWHDCVRISQHILDRAIMAWPDGTGSTNFPIEGSQSEFARLYKQGMLWNDQRRWQLWYFMVRHLEEAV